MTITNGYTALATIKGVDYLNITDNNSDTALEAIVTAISRAIDNETNRYFYKSTATEVRYFTSGSYDHLFVGDFVSITALKTDNLSGDRTYPFTWSATDYDLVPYDAATNSEPEPYRWIDITPRGTYQFPRGLAKGVYLDAVYGWPAVPSAITQACLLWSEYWWKSLKAPLGVSAMTMLGETQLKAPPPPPAAISLMNNYKLPVI